MRPGDTWCPKNKNKTVPGTIVVLDLDEAGKGSAVAVHIGQGGTQRSLINDGADADWRGSATV